MKTTTQFATRPRSRNVLRYDPLPRILKRPIFDPEAELVQIRDTDGAIAHPPDQILAHPFGQVVPALDFAASAAEDHSAKFIAQTAGGFRIPLVAETLSQGKELLLFSLLCVDSVLDQFQQHAILA